tara:strand:- start:32121 stop:32411 length:291 start_codon:yes stop_codon:yes gene_type:complete
LASNDVAQMAVLLQVVFVVPDFRVEVADDEHWASLVTKLLRERRNVFGLVHLARPEVHDQNIESMGARMQVAVMEAFGATFDDFDRLVAGQGDGVA